MQCSWEDEINGASRIDKYFRDVILSNSENDKKRIVVEDVNPSGVIRREGYRRMIWWSSGPPLRSRNLPAVILDGANKIPTGRRTAYDDD